MKGVKIEQICDQKGSSVKGLTSGKCTGSFGFWYSQYLFKSVPIEIRDRHSDLVQLETFGYIRAYAVHSDKLSQSKSTKSKKSEYILKVKVIFVSFFAAIILPKCAILGHKYHF